MRWVDRDLDGVCAEDGHYTYLRLPPSPPQITPLPVTVPLVELKEDLPPVQMKPEPATFGLSITDRTPPLPPQMTPLPEVMA